MRVAMVQVRIVRVRMHARFVAVRMDVRLAAVPRKIMRVPMVSVVQVLVRVFLCFVRVQVLVPLRQVQPDAERHQACREPECRPRTLAEHGDRQPRAEERRHGEIRSGARGATSPPEGE